MTATSDKTRSGDPKPKPQRRVRASHEWIEETIAVAQRRGLTPTKLSHYADGSVEVHFGEDQSAKKKPRGWDV